MMKPLLSSDIVMLIVRIGTGLLLFTNHGLEKIFGFDQMLKTFPDPIGVGQLSSLLFATIADALCPICILLGFLTRASSLIMLINLFIAFLTVHNANVFEVHGELIIIYLNDDHILYLWPGKYSIDKLVAKKI